MREATLLKVRITLGPYLGEVEEHFALGLEPGDTFMFSGQLLRFELAKIVNRSDTVGALYLAKQQLLPQGWRAHEGKSKSGGGRQHLKSPWGHVKGQKTRQKYKASDKFIVERRKKKRGRR